MDKFKYAFDNKRYHTWNYYLRNTFGEKVFKVSINAGFTCPNIDGSL
ncbi:MAG: TIGR01212 family radical SAM protein, partial [Clostridioides difficile]|nr:TIGR01212 family radical SAM protein [Clostridioides difficile]